MGVLETKRVIQPPKRRRMTKRKRTLIMCAKIAGLAAAALAHHEKNLRPLGAEVMTGGGNDFYRKIGYKGIHVDGHYRKV